MKFSRNKITVNFISLGCPKNLVDSEIMLGLLDKDNFEIIGSEQSSQVTIINTCSFVEDAKQESIDTILEITERKKQGLCEMIVVTGCLPQRYTKNLSRLLPEVDLFVGTGEFSRLPGLIRHKLAGKKRKTHVSLSAFLPDHLTPRKQITPFYTKFLKISEGCSHRCSFCVIPNIRGDLTSREPQDIRQEIITGVNQGIKEFNLVAQDLNEYGRDLSNRPSLYKLLSSLSEIEGDFWIRLMYMYPLQFPDKLIKLIAEHPHVVKYVDIPLQHISDNILQQMDRGSSSRYIHRLIENLKDAIPNIVLRTTFIVGHPGETDLDFKELKKFVIASKFDRVGVFKYSHEEGTPSYYMDNQIDDELKQDRMNELLSIQKEISLNKNKKMIGKTLKVLFEGQSKESDLLYQGRYYGQAPEIDGDILIRSGQAKLGEFCNVKIVDAFEYDLLGEIV